MNEKQIYLCPSMASRSAFGMRCAFPPEIAPRSPRTPRPGRSGAAARIGSVIGQLKLDFKYYSSADLSLFDEFAHRVRVAGTLVIREPPTPKQRHISAHQIVHGIVPWHKTFLLGDNELTLDPHCQAIIEADANYGAGHGRADAREGLRAKECGGMQRRVGRAGHLAPHFMPGVADEPVEIAGHHRSRPGHTLEWPDTRASCSVSPTNRPGFDRRWSARPPS
ncbi:hypothetical protein ACFKHW_27870 [Bradyrhizobium lupini]|uniref:hypothetical protein n=1 Tax=Rhizobium lupini TaxID=136996 RepID=UPI00366E13EF